MTTSSLLANVTKLPPWHPEPFFIVESRTDTIITRQFSCSMDGDTHNNIFFFTDEITSDSSTLSLPDLISASHYSSAVIVTNTRCSCRSRFTGLISVEPHPIAQSAVIA